MWNRMKDEQVATRGATGGRSSLAGSRLMAPVFVGNSARPSYICSVRTALGSSGRKSQKRKRKNQEVPNPPQEGTRQSQIFDTKRL